MPDHEINAFVSGVHNLLSDEIIPSDAASDENNWFTQDGRLKLIGGRLRIGTEGSGGPIQGEIFGYKADGTKVHWRKTSAGKIQYCTDGATWHDTVTGLSTTADYKFSNYSSLAGTFTFAFGPDGIFKFHNANPGSYSSLYDSTKNFKGYAFIDKGRSILWHRSAPNTDYTGLYGSYIDRQDSTVYTAVTSETIGSGDGSTLTFTGTLAFKGGGATRNCFGISVAVTGGETFTDNYLGVLTGSAGGSGTINYITGAWTLTFTVAPANSANNIKATYQWEDSNAKGVTDFTHSASRAAGEGFQVPQDEGGDAIQTVLIGADGNYYSLKSQSAYVLAIALDDTAAGTSNTVYRRNMGVPSIGGGVSTGKGIVFMNTANPERPELTILQRNQLGDAIEPIVLFPQFKFANYVYDDCHIDTFERYILVFCKTANAPANDTVLLCDIAQKTVDITSYNGRTSASSGGYLYIGSSITQTVYQLFSGFDDDGYPISNYWISKAESLRPHLRHFIPDFLKKVRKLRLRGLIDPAQSFEVYVNYDDAGFQLVGTIRGDAAYVDKATPQSIGSHFVGGAQIGGDVLTNVFPFFTELKLKAPKFRKRVVKFVALGIGYLDIEAMADHNITPFENRLPKRNRQKQNVSLDGADTDQSTPEY
jgi:hypothetical protein